MGMKYEVNEDSLAEQVEAALRSWVEEHMEGADKEDVDDVVFDLWQETGLSPAIRAATELLQERTFKMAQARVEEQKEGAEAAPGSRRDVRKVIYVSPDDMIGSGIDEWNEFVSEEVGEPYLQDINWEVRGVGDRGIALLITGYVDPDEEED